MTKHRLELFSDGVFAIVMTILVLDLHVPEDPGLRGLIDIAPALLVHAATFAAVGVLWLTHHGALARVTDISSRALLFNLVTLFWITLLPFAARNAAARPLEPLGASLMAACCGGFLSSALSMRLTARSAIDDNPRLASWRRRRLAIGFGMSAANLIGAVLAWISPWFGYGAALVMIATIGLLPSPPDVEKKIGQTAS
jgi:uncharacterized membrane protein